MKRHTNLRDKSYNNNHFRSSDPTWVRFGEMDWTVTDEDSATVDYAIEEIFMHPNFNPENYHNDIALLRFQGLSTFSNYIRPICLNILEDRPDQKFIATGWGHTTYKGDNSFSILTE